MPSVLSANSRVVATPNNISTVLSGETIILGMDAGVYFGLDRVGTRIWALLQTPRTLKEISETLVHEFEVSQDRALADLVSLATDMQARGLLTVVATAAP